VITDQIAGRNWAQWSRKFGLRHSTLRGDRTRKGDPELGANITQRKRVFIREALEEIFAALIPFSFPFQFCLSGVFLRSESVAQRVLWVFNDQVEINQGTIVPAAGSSMANGFGQKALQFGTGSGSIAEVMNNRTSGPRTH